MSKAPGYIEIEEKLEDVRTRFKQTFDSIQNAEIKKTQRNNFAVRFKYPLFILLCLVCIMALLAVQILGRQTDAMFIVCESIIFVGLVFFIVLCAVSWRYNLLNAKCAEIIQYHNGKAKCLISNVAGGGLKVEWEEARFYFSNKGEFELFEGGAKEYKPFIYKKIRGHARNYVLLDSKAILQNFFSGDTEVVFDDGEKVVLSSGFTFCIKNSQLQYFEIEGMYSECYENNFPLIAPFAVSPTYVFRYEFTKLNRTGHKLILPEVTRLACKEFFLTLPTEKDSDILIENLKK